MQELIQTQKIMDDERKQVILEILADKYCKQILQNTLEKPKSAIEISRDKEIPLSTVYRRIQQLHDSHMIRTSGIITDEGKRLFLYKSKIKEVNTRFYDGKITVDVVFNKN